MHSSTQNISDTNNTTSHNNDDPQNTGSSKDEQLLSSDYVFVQSEAPSGESVSTTQNQCQTYQAFAAALSNHLQDFYRQLRQVEKTAIKQGNGL